MMLPVKMTPDQRKRFKTACAEEGLTYGEFIIKWLDARDVTKRRQQRAQAHPLHQPTRKSHYPGGGA
ncbi:hypothetical protein Jolie1_061 [Mycobacterium phage Julie1]|uniref:Ribbon-helix-helix DNA binding domain protein n=1 Tax=Mycobacterium phage Julie1 TaxID=1463812 RepID=W8ECR6_9CAUD|nr:hypothetical protein CG90_gp61 [Mycobacterium phage Julie1]YP_009032285.1 hypothetical protein FH38_gp59 [Mycobacterium phage Hosp]AHJ88561.1 hypothetical protein Jolie1_061 [Mycobacterium phage Julie1]AHK12013.1 hypothetical protein Hosp_059 [Mycobacterium phage Hosp]